MIITETAGDEKDRKVKRVAEEDSYFTRYPWKKGTFRTIFHFLLIEKVLA